MSSKHTEIAEKCAKAVIDALKPLLENLTTRLTALEEEVKNINATTASAAAETNKSLTLQLQQLSKEINDASVLSQNSFANNPGSWADVAAGNIPPPQGGGRPPTMIESTVMAIQGAITLV